MLQQPIDAGAAASSGPMLAASSRLAELPQFLGDLSRRLAVATAERHSTALIRADIGNLDELSQALGEQADHAITTELSSRLRAALRAADRLAPIDRGKFAIMIGGLGDVAHATRIAERIKDAASRPLYLDGRHVPIALNFGVALSTPGYDRADGLLRKADAALRRNSPSVSSSGPRPAALARSVSSGGHHREAELRRAIAGGQLRLVYQPIVDLQRWRVEAIEALVRWEHPRFGLIAPPEFLPLAEKSGLILPLDRWVLENACRQARSWQAELDPDQPLLLSVNLSAHQLSNPYLVQQVSETLRQSELRPSTLQFEIKGSVLASGDSSMLALIRQLKDLGVRLAVDDFGQGEVSVSDLMRYPLDTLKIDYSSLGGGADFERSNLVNDIVRQARGFDLVVAGQRIETASQYADLHETGIDQGQGYYLARPAASVASKLLVGDRQLQRWDER